MTKIESTFNILNTTIWNEVKNWAKEDKITLITLLSQSLAETPALEDSKENNKHISPNISRFNNGKITESLGFKNALARMKELSGQGGRPVPADENGLDALIEKKYQL